jgi:type II secretory pathway component GspD/PulD (secretin)
MSLKGKIVSVCRDSGRVRNATLFALVVAALAMPLVAGLPCLQAQTSSATAIGGKPERVDALITEDWKNKPLPEVINYLAGKSGVNIIIMDDFANEVLVTLQVKELNWRDTLATVMKLTGCEAEEINAVLIHVRSIPRVDMDFAGTELTKIISLLGAKAGANIIISPEVVAAKTPITMRLSNVPWKDALQAVVKCGGFIMVEEAHDIVRIVSASRLLDQMETRMYTLKYLRPPSTFKATIKTSYAVGTPKATSDVIKEFSLLTMLKNALTKDPKSGKTLGALEYDLKSNTLVITDTKPALDKIEKILTRLDVEPRQVLVEVKYLSTKNTRLQELGVDWMFLGSTGFMSGAPGSGVMDSRADFDGDGTPDTAVRTRSPWPFGLGGGQSMGGLVPSFLTQYVTNAMLRLYRQDKQTVVRQSPSVVVVDGQEATIFVGDQRKYVSAVSITQVAGTEPTASVSTDTLETGFQLMIIPQIVEGTNTVIMEVIPRNSTLVQMDTFDTVGGSRVGLPQTRDATLVTKLVMESGLTVILGGLVGELADAKNKRIPFLSDIPLLGEVFQVEGKSREVEYIFFFITPRIITSSRATANDISTRTAQRATETDQEFEKIRIGPTREELEKMLDLRKGEQKSEFEQLEGK